MGTDPHQSIWPSLVDKTYGVLSLVPGCQAFIALCDDITNEGRPASRTLHRRDLYSAFPIDPGALVTGHFPIEKWRQLRKAKLSHFNGHRFDGETGFFMTSELITFDPPINISENVLLPIVNGWTGLYGEYRLTVKYLKFLRVDNDDFSAELDEVMSYFPPSSGLPGKQWPVKVIRAALEKHGCLTKTAESQLLKSVRMKQQDMQTDGAHQSHSAEDELHSDIDHVSESDYGPDTYKDTEPTAQAEAASASPSRFYKSKAEPNPVPKAFRTDSDYNRPRRRCLNFAEAATVPAGKCASPDDSHASADLDDSQASTKLNDSQPLAELDDSHASAELDDSQDASAEPGSDLHNVASSNPIAGPAISPVPGDGDLIPKGPQMPLPDYSNGARGVTQGNECGSEIGLTSHSAKKKKRKSEQQSNEAQNDSEVPKESGTKPSKARRKLDKAKLAAAQSRAENTEEQVEPSENTQRKKAKEETRTNRARINKSRLEKVQDDEDAGYIRMERSQVRAETGMLVTGNNRTCLEDAVANGSLWIEKRFGVQIDCEKLRSLFDKSTNTKFVEVRNYLREISLDLVRCTAEFMLCGGPELRLLKERQGLFIVQLIITLDNNDKDPDLHCVFYDARGTFLAWIRSFGTDLHIVTFHLCRLQMV